MRYILIEAFCNPVSVHYAGYTEKAVRRKIEECVWLEGHEYRRAPDGRISIDLQGYEKWVEGQRRAA